MPRIPLEDGSQVHDLAIIPSISLLTMQAFGA
jgi:hypothetical protein